MFSWIFPREGNFFELFGRLAEQIVFGAEEARDLLHHLEERTARAQKMKDIEHQGDAITHQTVELLQRTFITPLDRNDMHRLVSGMDNILDTIDACVQRVFLYDIEKVPAEAIGLANICVTSAQHVRNAVCGLENLKDPKHVLNSCVEINRLENDADQILRAVLAKLFKEEPDTRQLIKLKEICEMLEIATDRCEDVANLIDGIVLEYV
jgi:uncharacterized protein